MTLEGASSASLVFLSGNWFVVWDKTAGSLDLLYGGGGGVAVLIFDDAAPMLGWFTLYSVKFERQELRISISCDSIMINHEV